MIARTTAESGDRDRLLHAMLLLDLDIRQALSRPENLAGLTLTKGHAASPYF
jgi:hypothetical protein